MTNFILHEFNSVKSKGIRGQNLKFCLNHLYIPGCWWFTSVIPDTQEAENRRTEVCTQPGQTVHETPISKNPSQKAGLAKYVS
jgi:hypothetical protein